MLEKSYCENVVHTGGPPSEHSWSSYCVFSPVWCWLRRDMTLVKHLFDNIWWFRERWSSFCFCSARSWLRQDMTLVRYFLIISDDIEDQFLFFSLPDVVWDGTWHVSGRSINALHLSYPLLHQTDDEYLTLMMILWRWSAFQAQVSDGSLMVHSETDFGSITIARC